MLLRGALRADLAPLCDHGEWSADSYAINFTEAFVRARRGWAAGADHSMPPEDGA